MNEEKSDSEGLFKKFQSIRAGRKFGGHLTIAYGLMGFGIWKNLTLKLNSLAA